MVDRPVLTIFGASGTTGRRAVEEGVAAGYRVRAVEIGWPEDTPAAEHVEHVTANVLTDDLSPAVEGAAAVISALGVGGAKNLVDPPPLYTEGTLRIVEAMRQAGVTRLVVTSATFVETLERGPLHFRLAAGIGLYRVLQQMAEMERILRASGLDWTAVRPGWLLDAPPSDDARVTENVIPPDLIRTRTGDLARFMVRCAQTGEWVGQTPAIARDEPDVASDPPSMLREILC